MIALVLAAALNAQPTPAPCIPDLQAAPTGANQPLPCRPTKPVLMAASHAPLVVPPSIVPAPPIEQRGPDRWPLPPERAPKLLGQGTPCGPVTQLVSNDRRVQAQRLGRLPRAGAIYAVTRTVDGCPVATPMGYHPGYLLPGAADAPQVTPADAPPRRR